MPQDIDALLGELRRQWVAEALDEGEQDSEAASTVPAAPAENSTIKAIRAEAKRAEKRAAAAEAELAELRTFKEEATVAASKGRLEQAGLSPAQAQVFLQAGIEVTDENVRAFRSEVLGGSTPPEDTEGTVPNVAFAPAGVPTSEKTPEVISGRANIAKFVEEHGMEAASKAMEEGRLKL